MVSYGYILVLDKLVRVLRTENVIISINLVRRSHNHENMFCGIAIFCLIIMKMIIIIIEITGWYAIGFSPDSYILETFRCIKRRWLGKKKSDWSQCWYLYRISSHYSSWKLPRQTEPPCEYVILHTYCIFCWIIYKLKYNLENMSSSFKQFTWRSRAGNDVGI